jgi:hypothetical protein
MTASQGVLRNRVILAVVLLTCLYGTGASWLSIGQHVGRREDLVDIVSSAFVIFIAVSIAYRSSFWPDRIVFGAIAGAFALVIIRVASLTPAAMLALDVGHALMWTVAASVSLIALALDFRASRSA